MKIKICGLKKMEDIEAANDLNIDYVGFVFAQSKRQITKEEAKILKENLRIGIQAVGVFVNHDWGELFDLLAKQIIDVVQLHGQETEDDIKFIKAEFPWVRVVKAISVTCLDDIVQWENSSVDFLLLDHGKGGTGESFDWEILDGLDGFEKPYFIAGGLDPNNVKHVIKYHPYGVDVSGGVETDGVKDKMKMKQFVDEVKA